MIQRFPVLKKMTIEERSNLLQSLGDASLGSLEKTRIYKEKLQYLAENWPERQNYIDNNFVNQ